MKTQLSLATPLALKLNVEVEATVKGVDEMTGDEGDSSNSVLAGPEQDGNKLEQQVRRLLVSPVTRGVSERKKVDENEDMKDLAIAKRV